MGGRAADRSASRPPPPPSPPPSPDPLPTLGAGWAEIEIGLLAAAVAAPLLPAPFSALVLAALTAGWLVLRPPRRERLLGGVPLVLAVVILAGGWLAARPRPVSRQAWVAAATSEYAALWDALEARAAAARVAIEGPVAGPAARLDAFQRLGALVPPSGAERAAVLLVDGDGEAKAWAGTGLLLEPEPVALPRAGPAFRAGFSSVTVMAVEPLSTERRPWRVVVGRSLASDRLPFDPPDGAERDRFRWSLLAPETPVPAGALRLAPPGRPAMVVRPITEPPASSGLSALAAHAAWGLVGLALLALALSRGAGLAVAGLAPAGEAGRGRAAFHNGLLGAMGAAAWSLAATASPAAATGLATAVLLAGGALWRGLRPRERLPPAPVALALGAFAALAPAALAWVYLSVVGPIDLGARLLGDGEAFTLRLTATLVALAALALAAPLCAPPRGGHARWGAAAAVTLIAAAAAVDLPVLALVLLALGGVASCRWLGGRSPWPRPGLLALLALLAALAATAGWELSYRHALRERLLAETLPAMAPPSGSEVAAVRRDLEAFFATLDLAQLAPRPTASMELQDLAFSVWRRSPLTRRNALSALVLEPAVPSAGSVFSFGLLLDEESRVEWDPSERPDLELPVWNDLGITGETPVTAGGRLWGTARWWLLPRPGFPLGGRLEVDEVLRALLKGGRRELTAPRGIPEPARYALYPPRGRALISPWEEESPPLPPELAAVTEGPATTAVVATPEGSAWAFARRGGDGYEVLFLPRLGPVEALDRLGTQVAGVLLVLALGALLALLPALPRPAFRDLVRRTVRSYSRRLVLVYTGLLLVPLLLLNFVLLRAVEVSLQRDQRARGEQALLAAERAVVERILSPEPGFAFTTALSAQYLRGLSRLVDHDVNVYHGSDFLASSRGELFTAGLLPRRIPGEVYARLALVGFGTASRLTRIVDTRYLELYAPVTLPGDAEEEPRLFLSVPLLAQQEAAAEVLSALRRRALVASAGLFVLLLVVGGRLARNFTTPINELVEGTRRIAAGATSLDLAPTELELAALVEAVDDMARRIAHGRDELLREKAVVERMVENITSGVVSLDAEGRVLMHNRVAAELFGAGVGEPLSATVAASEELAPVGAFLARSAAAGPGAAASLRETVRLGSGREGESEWTLVWVPLPGAGEPSALLVVEDVTEAFRGQRLEAWAEMARIIAHEIKNPLTPVRLSAEHMRQVWANDPEHFGAIFERCTANILEQVDELQQIASEFSIYSRIPEIELRQGDLRAAMAPLAEAYQVAPPPGVEVAFFAADEPVAARFDARLLSRAVRNLLENALRASASGGRVELAVEQSDGCALIRVADHGPGVPAELLSRVFDPYFSTHDTGTGLGLPIARRIVEQHGGEIAARNRPTGGLEVEIKIPAS